ncbi:hypothetical protein [Methylobacterium currus]|uniref:hypothetical protein n=1 Tax=Methylobacterium currus TaxID=2051553 RepID=UPI000F4DBAF4|nr:hypothetical protein [Methylobacterium currus]
MPPEYKTWPEIESMVIAHIREQPIGKKLIKFELLYESAGSEPLGFDVETINMSGTEHAVLAKYIALFIENLEKSYHILP